MGSVGYVIPSDRHLSAMARRTQAEGVLGRGAEAMTDPVRLRSRDFVDASVIGWRSRPRGAAHAIRSRGADRRLREAIPGAAGVARVAGEGFRPSVQGRRQI